MTSVHFLKEALQYIKSGERSKAISLLKRLLRTEPSNEEAWLLMAHLLENEDHIRKCYMQVLELNPENPRALEKLAELNRQFEDDDSSSPFSTMTFTQEEIAERLAQEEAIGQEKEAPLDLFPQQDMIVLGEKTLLGDDEGHNKRADDKKDLEIESTQPEKQLAVVDNDIDNVDQPEEEQPKTPEFMEEEIPEWLSEAVEEPERVVNTAEKPSSRGFWILVGILGLIAVLAYGYLIIDSFSKPKTPVVIFTESPQTELGAGQTKTLVPTVTGVPVLATAVPTNTIVPSSTPTNSPTMEPIFTAVSTAKAEASIGTPYPTVVYGSLEEKWVRPVLAGELAVGLCDSIVEMANTPVDDEDILGNLLGMGLSVGLMEGANALVSEWIPPEEVAAVSLALSAEISEFSLNAGSALEGAENLDAAAPMLEIGCMDIKAANDALLAEMEAQGVILADVMAAAETFMASAMPEEESVPGVGFSRETPFERDAVIVAQEWEIRILDYARGDAAWDLLDSASIHNEPPPVGWEYVLVNVNMKSLHQADEAYIWVSGLDFNATGSSNWVYNHVSCAWGTGKVTANCMSVSPLFSFETFAVPDFDPSEFYINVQPPDPRLDGDLNPGEETSGWVAFMVRAGETDLMLMFDDFSSFDPPPFIALDDSASLNATDEIMEIVPNSAGISLDSPAGEGDLVITDDWQLALVDQLRGDDAWVFLRGYSPDDDAPPDGQEYLILQFETTYLGEESSGLSNWNFIPVDSDGTVYESEVYSWLEPELYQEVFAGGTHEGYAVLLIPEGRDDLRVKYSTWLSFGDEQSRYFDIE